jgi:hypothetical protein
VRVAVVVGVVVGAGSCDSGSSGWVGFSLLALAKGIDCGRDRVCEVRDERHQV